MMDWRFFVQATMSFTVMSFGIAMYFTSDDSNFQSSGAAMASFVLGLWMKGVGKVVTRSEPEPRAADVEQVI